MTDESLLACIQRHWRNLDERFVGMLVNHNLFSTVVPIPETKQREIQMAVEAECLNPFAIDLEVALHIARQYLFAQFLQFLYPLLLVLSHLHVVFLEEVRVIGIHIYCLHKLCLPFSLAALVCTVDVSPEQRNGDVLPSLHVTPEITEFHVSLLDNQLIPRRISHKCL